MPRLNTHLHVPCASISSNTEVATQIIRQRRSSFNLRPHLLTFPTWHLLPRGAMASQPSISPDACSDATATPESTSESSHDNHRPSSPEEIALHIKALSQSTVAAANARDLSPDSPGWSHIISDERYRIDGKPADINDHLDRLRKVIEEYPGFHLEVLCQDATVATHCRTAELFEVFEMSHGNGVITHQAMATHWELREGKWWCINCSTTRGMIFDS